MSWLFSQALVGEYLEENSSDGEPSAPLNGNHTQQAYCAPDKMTAFSRLSRFGMTFKPLTENRGEGLLTLYREGFHAKTLVQQEEAQELTESAAGCGEKWRASFTKYDPDSHSWKTHQCSLVEDLEPFLETWPQWGLMRDGECWEQRTLEQTIRGTGYGLSPNGVDSFHTPNTTGLDGGSNSRKALKKRTEKWPTPTASQARSEGMILQMRQLVENGTTTISEAEAMIGGSLTPKRMKFPTPKVQDSRHAKMRHLNKSDDHWKSNLGEVVSAEVNGGKLNPTWVEKLMGWPLGWTDLKPLVMDKSHFVQRPHGEFLEVNNG
jgi:DNA (cytosine-5)-methyltransferase 1